MSGSKAVDVEEAMQLFAGAVTRYINMSFGIQNRPREACKNKHQPICIVCGGRNAGKSTLCQRLIRKGMTEIQNQNAIPVSSRKFMYLETDCGQPEFAAPGYIGLYMIDNTHEINYDKRTDNATNRCVKYWNHKKAVFGKYIGSLSPKVCIGE